MLAGQNKEEKEMTGKKVEEGRTEQVHLIMREHINASGRLFGGVLLRWIDEVAGIVAMRHSGNKNVTTAAIDNLQFKKPTFEGDLLVMIGYVTYVGRTSMEVEVDSYVEDSKGMRHAVNRAFLVMVSVGEDNRPIPVPGILIETEAEKARYESGRQRCQMRKDRRRSGI